MAKVPFYHKPNQNKNCLLSILSTTLARYQTGPCLACNRPICLRLVWLAWSAWMVVELVVLPLTSSIQAMSLLCWVLVYLVRQFIFDRWYLGRFLFWYPVHHEICGIPSCRHILLEFILRVFSVLQSARLGWDSWLFNLAWSLLFMCREPFRS